MAYSDPQSVNIVGTAVSLPRVGSGIGTGSFTSNDGNTKLIIQNAYGKRIRRAAKVTYNKVAPDPLISSQNVVRSVSVSVVVDQPVLGFTVTELNTIVAGFATWLTATAGANTIKLLGGEN